MRVKVSHWFISFRDFSIKFEGRKKYLFCIKNRQLEVSFPTPFTDLKSVSKQKSYGVSKSKMSEFRPLRKAGVGSLPKLISSKPLEALASFWWHCTREGVLYNMCENQKK